MSTTTTATTTVTTSNTITSTLAPTDSRSSVSARLETLLAGSFFVSKDNAAKWCMDLGLTLEQLMMELVLIATRYAVVPTSAFRVGTVGLGSSGNLYMGFNVEFPGCPLNYSDVARYRKDDGLVKLAVNYPPCGHCRQFLKEMHLQENLIIHIRGRDPLRLADMLPNAFVPSDLGHSSKMLCVSSEAHHLDEKHRSALADTALTALAASWGPYTNPSAVAIETQTGKICTGVYLESCAYNPSLSPLQACLCEVAMQRKPDTEVDWSVVKRVVLLEKKGAVISHETNCRSFIRTIAPHAIFEHVLYH